MSKNKKIILFLFFLVSISFFAFTQDVNADAETDCLATQGNTWSETGGCLTPEQSCNATGGVWDETGGCSQSTSPSEPSTTTNRPATQSSSSGLQYPLLEKIPGTEGLGSDLPGYLKAIYKVALIIVILSAVLMISIGGFMYLTSAGNTSYMETSKGVIWDAIIGLIVALVAWLLLNTINPDLTTISINGFSITTVPGVPAAPVEAGIPTAPAEGTLTDAAARSRLNSAGISVTSRGSCSDQSNPNCTSLQGIPSAAIDNIISLKNISSCNFNVTGGTETGHASHGSGIPILDVSEDPCLKSFLQTNRTSGNLTSTAHITKICATQNNQSVAFNCSFIEPVPHFHLVFSL